MHEPIHHHREEASNRQRDLITRFEPHSLRTFTPTQAVLARSSGIFHWTPEGRRLYDFSSGVLVANLGHHPSRWMKRFVDLLGWSGNPWEKAGAFFEAVPLTAYNAITEVEALATRKLAETLQNRPGGKRLQQVLWSASGSEAIQKALWASMARERGRDMILATRFGFHGKKGLAGAVTGSEQDKERDPRVRFVSFPMKECVDVGLRDSSFDPAPYRRELDALIHQYGRRFGTLITEPYLGGGGSYHPPKAYHRMLQEFCREHDIVFILDEVQSNFGRTGDLFAFETYGIEPDIVVLGKGLGNGVPVAAAVGRSDLFGALDYGEASDTWSANPMCCAAVLATLEEFEATDILGPMRKASAVLEEGLVGLKRHPFVANVRGEKGGMVWGIEMRDFADRTAAEWASAAVLNCYLGVGDQGIHLLGALAKKVLRISPPCIITEEQARDAVDLLDRLLGSMISYGEMPAQEHALA